MQKVVKVDRNGLWIEDVVIDGDESIPVDCIETPCPDGFYKPKWDGAKWIEGLSQTEIDEIKATLPENIKAEAVAEMESATTISALKAAMLKFVSTSN